MPEEPPVPKLIECDKCKHRWYSVAEKKFIACPHCYRTMQNPHYNPSKYLGENDDRK